MLAEIQFECTHCGQRLAVEPAAAGQSANCPNCQAPIVVPSAVESAARLRPRNHARVDHARAEPTHTDHVHVDGAAGVHPQVDGPDHAREANVFRERWAEATASITRLQKDLSQALANASKLRTDLATSNAERASVASGAELLQRELERVSAEKFALQEDLEINRQKTSATEAQLEARERELVEAQAAIEHAMGETSAAHENMDELIRDGASLRHELEQLIAEKDTITGELGAAQEHIGELESHLKSVEDAHDALMGAHGQLESENATLRNDLLASATGRELLELRERIKVAESERARAERLAEQAEVDRKKAADSERKQRGDVEALLRRCETAEKRADATSEPQIKKDNDVLRGIVNRQKEELERQYAELSRFRKARMGIRMGYLILGMAAVGVVWLAIQSVPALLHALHMIDF